MLFIHANVPVLDRINYYSGLVYLLPRVIIRLYRKTCRNRYFSGRNFQDGVYVNLPRNKDDILLQMRSLYEVSDFYSFFCTFCLCRRKENDCKQRQFYSTKDEETDSTFCNLTGLVLFLTAEESGFF